MRSKPVLVLASVCLLAVAALMGQGISEDEIRWGSRPYLPGGLAAIKVLSDLVEVPVVVRDKNGKLVAGLQKSDFEVLDNRKPQIISSFSVQTALQVTSDTKTDPAPAGSAPAPPAFTPRYVALFFDDVNTSAANLAFARQGAEKLIRKGLDPGEKMGIFTSSGTLSWDFTENTQDLLNTLAKLQQYLRMRNSSSGDCPPMGVNQAWVIDHSGGFTIEYQLALGAARGCCAGAPDACVRSTATRVVSIAETFSRNTLDSLLDVVRYLGRMPGRRIAVLASAGFLSRSLPKEQQRVIEEALRDKVIINSLDAKGLEVASGYLADGERDTKNFPMALIAQGTGGTFFHNNNDLGLGLTELSVLPSVSYVLGFSPDSLKPDGSLHSLKVKLLTQAGLTVDSRPSYVAPGGELTPSEKRYRRLEQAVLASNSPMEIPTEVTTEPGMLASGVPVLKISVHVNVSKLPFQKIGDRKVERLIFVAALFDTQGHFLTGVQGVMDLRLKDATLATVSSEGLTAKLSFDAPAGSYRLRQVVQETWNGHLTAISRPVVIH